MYSRSDNTSLRYKIVNKIYFFSTEMDAVSFYGRKSSKIRISNTCGIIESSSDVYVAPIPGNSAISDCESDEDSGDEATSYFLVKLNFINNLTINLNNLLLNFSAYYLQFLIFNLFSNIFYVVFF